ncbi:unnamed protein product [Cercopithifilaria johnstoni]|uniref:Uncharacterized protein n=1 Tax=Cercopithifilaria johnstoni TaxID=2874296 RepID=A0A8J2PQS0_9BILA|nr:unnamed protein product [Cercopithifilaria johnstoni]
MVVNSQKNLNLHKFKFIRIYNKIFKAVVNHLVTLKYGKIKRRSVVQLSSKLILPPMEMEMAERWHMNWEYVVYRISHGLHFAIMKNIADITPQQRVIYIRTQKCYPRRFIRSNIALVQKKKILKASESNSIKMCTVDRGEPCHVKNINISEKRKCIAINDYSTSEHIGRCSSRSTLIKCDCCYDTIETE